MRKVHYTDGRGSSIRHVGGRRGVEGIDVESQSRNFVETPRVPLVYGQDRHSCKGRRESYKRALSR